MDVIEQARRGKNAFQNARISEEQRTGVLYTLANLLNLRREKILLANAEDVLRAKRQGTAESMIDRLSLTNERIEAMAKGLEVVAQLPSPLGRVKKAWTLENGLEITQVTVALGLIGMIYEARPNVTIEAASLIFKAGNAVLLRGGSAASCSNRCLVSLFQEALTAHQVDEQLVQLLDDGSREGSLAMMQCQAYIDVLVPRGGHSLISQVLRDARVPVIRTGEGNCHTYVDATAELEQALDIVENAKMQRPSVCNALETLLVHKDIAAAFLPRLAERIGSGCEFRADERAIVYLGSGAKAAVESDWGSEYNDYILAVKVVDSLDEALLHIRRYGTMHSEVILTRNSEHVERFLNEVDAAVVYVNASSRFTDGGQFGFGGELGISTQKLHARGPMGLEALVSYKYLIRGDGQVR